MNKPMTIDQQIEAMIKMVKDLPGFDVEGIKKHLQKTGKKDMVSVGEELVGAEKELVEVMKANNDNRFSQMQAALDNILDIVKQIAKGGEKKG